MSWIVWCRVAPEPRKSGGWWEQTPWQAVARIVDEQQALGRAQMAADYSHRFHMNLEYLTLRAGETP